MFYSKLFESSLCLSNVVELFLDDRNVLVRINIHDTEELIGQNGGVFPVLLDDIHELAFFREFRKRPVILRVDFKSVATESQNRNGKV